MTVASLTATFAITPETRHAAIVLHRAAQAYYESCGDFLRASVHDSQAQDYEDSLDSTPNDGNNLAEALSEDREPNK